jgi:hypothetical protein
MFDLLDGLPVHILVIHAVVVLIPLMFIVTLAFTIRPKWRPGLSWAIAGNVVATGAALVAKESGERLQQRLGDQANLNNTGPKIIIAELHGERGDVLWYFALALLIASIIAFVLARQESTVLIGFAIGLVVITGAGATYWTFLTGDSGSRAVWEGTIASTR